MPYTCGKERARIAGICKSLGGDFVPKFTKKEKVRETMESNPIMKSMKTQPTEKQLEKKRLKRLKFEAKKLSKQERLKILHDSRLKGQALKEALGLLPISQS